MAPVIEAISSKLIECSDGSAAYEGTFDPEWLVGSVANGGFTLGMINECVRDFLSNRSESKHPDLFHASATYLSATDAKAAWTVDIRVIKRGGRYTNIDADLSQKSHKTGKDDVRLQARFIYTDFRREHSESSTEHHTILPGSSYYPPFPCKTRPEDCGESLFQNSKKLHFWQRLSSLMDPKALKEFEGENRLGAAGYYQFLQDEIKCDAKSDEIAKFNYAAILMYSDMTEKLIDYLPQDSSKGKRGSSWFPTMFLSVEMKRKLPDFALLRAASISRTRFADHGQFEIDTEIWSHPDDAQRLGLPNNVESVILCISRQVALTVTIEAQMAITNKYGKSKM